eukprot:Hpha_TRINITY_DN16575_c7_g1::TRINITY_DN16575_c7_g1_i1::g.135823::m.135823
MIVERVLDVLTGCLQRDGDSKMNAFIKRNLTPLVFCGLVLTTATAIEGPGVMLQIYPMVVAAGGCLAYLVAAVLGADMGLVLDVLLPLWVCTTCAYDSLVAATQQPRFWSLVVLLLDISLVFERMRVPPICLFIVITYLLFESVEAGIRYGLYDYTKTGAEMPSCVEPPCAIGIMDALRAWAWSAGLTLLGDFYLTRRFATGLRTQLGRVNTSVEVAGEVTAALANYNTVAAEAAVDKAAAADIPVELASAFRQLIRNLEMYKPYLPHSCLIAADPIEQSEPIASPKIARASAVSFEGSLSASFKSVKMRSMRSNSQSKMSLDTTSCLSSPGSPLAFLPLALSTGPTTQRVAPRHARVSLAASNMIGYLSRTDNFTSLAHMDWVAEDVGVWMSAVVDAKGVVDLISGDRRYASFNARQRCDQHAAAAMDVLSQRSGAGWSGCVVSGQAVCGDFGSSDFLRFMVLGGVSSSLHTLERTAAKWRISILADSVAYASAFVVWEGKLLGAAWAPKRGSAPLRLFNMTGGRKNFERQETEEWMYVLANMPQSAHHNDNEAKEKLVKAKLASVRALGRDESESEEEEKEEDGLVWKITEVGLWKC